MSDASHALVGKKLGPYRIESLLASGAMGDVFRGVHEQLARPVAIKTLKPAVAADRNLLERFFAEARAVNLIRHENIVECTDLVREDDGRAYMVMELLEGRTLGHAIRESRGMAAKRAVRIAMQIADALGAAHDKDIIHRDLKPENVFLIRRAGSDDYVKILDFGIARLRPETSGIEATQSGALIGTPAYMSPEQVNGEPVGPASDIYSLGVLLFHMLAGKPPFDGTSSLQIMMAHLSAEAPRIDDFAKVPTALSELIARILRKQPDERPRSMAELRAELERSIAPDEERTARRRRETFGTEPTDPQAEPTGEDEPPAEEAIATDPTNWSTTGDSSGARRAPPTAAIDTVRDHRARGVPALALALVLVAGGVIAMLLVRGVQKDPPTASDDGDPTVESSPARHALDGLLRDGHREPLAPDGCMTSDAATLDVLIEAAGLLRDGAPGGERAEDRRALDALIAFRAPREHATEYWHLLAKARLYAGAPADEVVAAAAEALRQCERYAAPHLVAGTASFHADRNDDAEDHYGRALAIDPEFAAARFNLGLVQLATQQIQPAIDSLSWVIDRDARNIDALLARGQAHLMARSTQAALLDLRRAAELDPRNGDAQLLLGLAHDKAGDAASARRAFCAARDLGVARADELCEP